MSALETSFEDGVLRITLAAPGSGNLLDDDMLAAVLAAMDQHPRAGVLVLAAEGPDFSIGRPKPGATRGLDEAVVGKVRGALEMVHALNMRLRDWPGAAVGVLRGRALGAAAGLLVNCDVVLAEKDARLGFAEITYDLPPALVASYLPNRLAPRIAQYLLLTGAEIDMERALAWGLVHEVCEAGGLAARTEALAAFFAARAPGAVDHCKRSLYGFANLDHAVAGPKGIDRVLAWLCRDIDDGI